MKKQFKRIMCIMMVLVMCLSIQTPAFAAKSAKYTAAEKAYKNYMAKKHGYYSIRDLDGNGMPELIMSLPSTKGSYVYTYNYSTRKMVRIAALSLGNAVLPDNRAFFSASKHMVCFYNSSTGYDQYRFYKISGSKATLVYKYEAKLTSRFGSNAGYYINGRLYTRNFTTMINNLNNRLKTFKALEYRA